MLKKLNKISFRLVFWGFFYFFLFSLLLRGSFGYMDPDLGWHLKVGQEISETGVVPSINHYNYPYEGSWVDHEWLSNLISYQIYDNFGYPALVIFFALLIILILILLNIWVQRLIPGVPLYLLVFLQTLGVIGAMPHFGVRMQEFGPLFLLFLLLVIDEYSRKKNWRVLLFLPLIFYFWACLHASFLIGFFLLAAWGAIKIGENLIYRYSSGLAIDFSQRIKCRKMLVFAFASLVSFVATLFTPYKFELYSFLFGYRDSYYQSNIQEWLSQFSFPFYYRQLIYLAILSFSLILYFYYLREKRNKYKINLWQLFLAFLFLFLSFQARRHFPLMFVSTFILMVEVLNTAFRDQDKSGNAPVKLWLKVYLILCLLLATLSHLVQVNFIKNPFVAFCHEYPCAAVNFLRERPELDNLNLFNYYTWGGYMIYNLPERKLFIDGRLPQMPLAGHTYLREYHEFFKDAEKTKEKLAEHDIRLVMIMAEDKKHLVKDWEKFVFGLESEDFYGKNEFRSYILNSSDWEMIYHDPVSVIYLRKQ